MKPLLTPLGLVRGKQAIKLADENGLLLNCDACSAGPAKTNATPTQALKYLAINPRFVWLDLS